MKLNAEIIYERLKRIYPVKMYGNEISKMIFSSPELYIDNTLRFRSNHLYLATVEHLPNRPVIEKNVLLICIGDNTRLSYYEEHCTVILFKKKVDFFEVYKSLQDIFQQFHNWESSLLELFMKAPTIQDALNCSFPIFQRPVFVLDSTFQYVANTYSDDMVQDRNWQQTQGNLDPEAFLTYLKEQDLSMDRHGAFLLDVGTIHVLCVNLFNSNDDYTGCLCIDQTVRPFVSGEDWLAEYLAAILEKISEMNPLLLNTERGSLKNTLKTMMSELPLGRNQKALLKTSNMKREYYCLSIHQQKFFSSFPVNYICSIFESLFTDSIFFGQNTTILGLVPEEALPEHPLSERPLPERPVLPAEEKKLLSIVEEMQLCIGISNLFRDFYLLPVYYRQAEAAIDHGHIYSPNQSIYRFSEFMLSEMIANSLDGQPAEAYFPKGFRSLLEHDQNSSISYLDTLSVFLEENMSFAKAARRLYIHRSTLIERITRIESDLSMDLNDPDCRLHLQILLKALSIEKKLKER